MDAPGQERSTTPPAPTTAGRSTRHEIDLEALRGCRRFPARRVDDPGPGDDLAADDTRRSP